MPSFATRLKALILCLVLAIGALGISGVARATSPPTMTWVSQTGSLTGQATPATIITATTGARIILQYANLSVSTATPITILEKTSTGTLINIATVGLGTAAPFELKQNDVFAGTGYVTGAGSSIVWTVTSTATASGTFRFLLN